MSWKKKIVYAGLVTGFFFVLFLFLLRLVNLQMGVREFRLQGEHKFDLWAPDDELGFLNRPNFECYSGGVYRVRTDPNGFRAERPVAAAKAPGKTRIICAGDSVTWGYMTPTDQTFAAQLERQDPSYEVINAGVIGYSLSQERVFVERLRKFSPDVILINLCRNDVLPTEDPFKNIRALQRAQLKEQLERQQWTAEEKKLLARTDDIFVNAKRVYREVRKFSPEEKEVLNQVFFQPPLEELARMQEPRIIFLLIPPLDKFEKYEALKKRVVESGIEFIDFPELVDGPPTLLKWYRSPLRKTILNDLHNIFAVSERRQVYQKRNYMDAMHTTPKGNRLIAEKIHAYLLKPAPD